ncbi:MAG TPA: 3-methyl-2-oxobutanoate hydroxymethyltransferase [Firmicutes bacterium]|jgi:3-methyl-2-oxobutanoate hydroxymethyltransferase|nr:3-methyl-2-oxobutanoate hydroxymethyltransferase [Bacillota bacterium]HOQ23711.1 3-methyl-2-oxobutanoate hydroxymethyltransferase [Bacillota bacterium]HPT68366.1 3-methyl-2-oxobutanoate hydroxymethyltransferase [Bacillota bacterium]
MENSRTTLKKIREAKATGEKLTMITAYDYPGAQLAEAAGVDMILVGDSLGNVVLGYETTLPVTMDDMVHHTKAVARGNKTALVVADMPFLSYQVSIEEAVKNAGRLMQEGGAHAVKLEGGRDVVPIVRRLTSAGIPVMGHLGFTPQSVHQLGGFLMQGKSAQAAKDLLDDAKALEEAGAFAVVLELVPAEVAAAITRRLNIPTIGIGSGPACDGQVQVFHDVLGLNASFTPRHAKRYAELYAVGSRALSEYVAEVRSGQFPGPEQTRQMQDEEKAEFLRLLGLEEGKEA